MTQLAWVFFHGIVERFELPPLLKRGLVREMSAEDR